MNKEELTDFLNEIILNELESLSDIEDRNCYGSGDCNGRIDLARTILRKLNGDDE